MKRLIYLVPLAVLLICGSRLEAAPVNPTQAANAVRGWLKADGTPLGAKLGTQIGRVESFKDKTGVTLYYVVNLKPSGFVIVAADDAAEPIVAFVSEGRFDPSEKNPLGALVTRDLPNRIANAKKISGTQKANKIQIKWKNLIDAWLNIQDGKTGGTSPAKPKFVSSISDLRVGPLLVTSWGQSTDAHGNACYNYFTPPHEAGNPSNVVCGCVATVMAQTMYYFKYPNTGVGTNMFTFTFDNNPVLWDWPLRGGDDKGGVYDWASMPANPNSVTTTTSQRAAIGRLTYDAGISVNMMYSDTAAGSGAFMTNAKAALVTTFKYSNAILTESNSINTGYDLADMINANLDAKAPVIFGIDNSVGGHAVVCDGYGYDAYNTLYHHINMGWDGVDNAWYHLPLLDLTDTVPYNNFNACIYNVFTNGSGEIISGRVLDANGLPIANTLVSAANTQSTNWVVTDTHGIYAFSGLSSGTAYTITALGNGFAPASQQCSTGLSVDNSPNCGNKWGINFALQLAQQQPYFIIQPANQTVTAGSAASYRVIVIGQSPLTFQWQYQPSGSSSWSNFSDGTAVSGSQTSVLIINSTTLALSGENVRCNVGNTLGTTNSFAASLTVNGISPSFSLQPSSQSVVAGTNAVFTAFATGTAPITYRWQYQPSGSLTWNDVVDDATNSGSQTSTLSINPTDLTLNGKPLQCIAANAWGSTTSTPAYLFVTPNNSMPISVYTLAGFPAITGSSNGIGTNALFFNPRGIAVDANTNIFIADMGNHVIRMLSPSVSGWSSATIAGLAGSFGSADGTGSVARFNGPYGIAVDSADNVYVADTANHTLRKVAQSGTNWTVTTILGLAGTSGTNDGSGSAVRFNLPMGLAVDSSGNLFVADEGNQIVRKVSFNGINWTATTLAGLAKHSGNTDGTNFVARFGNPYALTVDGSGRIFVVDQYYNCIRQITPNNSNWVVTTIGVSAANGGSTDGSANVARFKQPTGIVASPDGDLYVADSGNNTIRRIAPNGLGWSIFTVAGLAGSPGSVDGTGTAARLSTPFGIAVDSFTNLYITDLFNDTIRGPAPVVTPTPSIVNLVKLAAPRTFTVSWNAVAGHAYQVLYKTNLIQSAWSIYTNITPGNWTGSVSITVASDPQRFYRVVPAP